MSAYRDHLHPGLPASGAELDRIKLWFISSSDSSIDNGDSSVIEVNVQNREPHHGISSIGVHAVNIPNHFYNVSEERKTNTLVLTHSTEGQSTVTVADGHYTLSELFTAIAAAHVGTVGVTSIALAQDDNSGKASFTSVIVGGGVINLDTSPLALELGFTDFTTTVATGVALTGAKIPDIAYPKFIQIGCEEIASRNIWGPTKGYKLIHIQQVDQPFLEEIVALPSVPFHVKIDEHISSMRISLKDHEGEPLNVNNSDWSIILKVHAH